MTTIFLRFPDEATFLSAAAPYTDDEGNINLPNLDVIGTIYEGGEYDAEGTVISPPVAVPGWHVNMAGSTVPPEFEPYVIERPEHPYRVFAESPPLPPKTPKVRRFTSLQVLDLFTEGEQLAIVEATLTEPAVKLWYDRLLAASFVSYEDPRTEGGLQALVDAELLTPERKDEIVAAMQPQEV